MSKLLSFFSGSQSEIETFSGSKKFKRDFDFFMFSGRKLAKFKSYFCLFKFGNQIRGQQIQDDTCVFAHASPSERGSVISLSWLNVCMATREKIFDFYYRFFVAHSKFEHKRMNGRLMSTGFSHSVTSYVDASFSINYSSSPCNFGVSHFSSSLIMILLQWHEQNYISRDKKGGLVLCAI